MKQYKPTIVQIVAILVLVPLVGYFTWVELNSRAPHVSGGIGDKLLTVTGTLDGKEFTKSEYDTDTAISGDEYFVNKSKAEVVIKRNIKGDVAFGINRAGTWKQTKKEPSNKTRTVDNADNSETFVVKEVEDGMKVDLVLNTRPATNSVTFEIEGWEDFVFKYQPPLDEEYSDAVNCSATECDSDNDGELDRFRPEDVVGSYAVFKKRADGSDVSNADKWGHIYRPLIVDNDGSEEWGQYSYDKGRLTVTYSEDMRANGALPITIDPVFGNETCGGTELAPAGDDFYGTVETAPENGTVSSISVCGRQAVGNNFKGMLVLDTALTIVSGGIGNATALSSNPTTSEWATSTGMTASITSGTSYLIGTIQDGQAFISYDSGSSGDGERDTSNSYASPADLGTSQARSEIFAIKAEYVAAGGGDADPGFRPNRGRHR